jgi:hypothetical protein
MCVCGSLPQLGEWKVFKHPLIWTEGNIFVTETPIISEKYYYKYKYVVMKEDGKTMKYWEAGINRIADCEVLTHVL